VQETKILHQLSTLQGLFPITGMFERIGMDITGDFPKVDGYYKLLVMNSCYT